MIGPRPHLADTESGRGTELAVFGETEMGPLALVLVLAFALLDDRGGVDREELDGDLRDVTTKEARRGCTCSTIATATMVMRTMWNKAKQPPLPLAVSSSSPQPPRSSYIREMAFR
jgi:hypothetical protein